MTTKKTLLAPQLSLLLVPLNQLHADGRTAQIAITGDLAPDGDGFLGTSISLPILSNSGDVVFYDNNITGTVGGVTDSVGLFRAKNGVLFQIIREGQIAPDGNGLLGSFDTPLLNASGNGAFRATLNATAGGSTS